jgi:uncharacterized membrane protein
MTKNLRLWEIDLFRGLAIIGMVIYHFFFDSFFLGNTGPDPFSLPIIILARTTASTFLFLVGFSFSISWSKYRRIDYVLYFINVLTRVIKVFLAASLVSFATYLISPDFTVRFGILHLIAFSLFLLLPFILFQNRLPLLPLSLGLILIGSLTNPRPNYSTFDYYPLIPWFGIVLLGFILANHYQSHRPEIFTREPHQVVSPLIALGRHSLSAYLLHQPILFGLLFILKR